MAGDVVEASEARKTLLLSNRVLPKRLTECVREKILMMLQDAARHVSGKPAGSDCVHLNIVAAHLQARSLVKAMTPPLLA